MSCDTPNMNCVLFVHNSTYVAHLKHGNLHDTKQAACSERA